MTGANIWHNKCKMKLSYADATYIWYVNMQGNFFDMGLIYVGIQNDYDSM